MTASAIPALAALADTVLELGNNLNHDDWNTPSACPGWSVHDVVVHLTCTLREIVDPAGLPGPVPGSVERTNDAAVNAYRGRNPQDTLSDYRTLLHPALTGLRDLQTGPAAAETVDFDDAGKYPAHLIADSLVFDHYCHLRHDLAGRGPLRITVPADPPTLTASRIWMLAGLPQMSPPRLTQVLADPVGLDLAGPGGGSWILRTVAGQVTVQPGPTEDTAARLISTVDDFMLWSTHRIDWRDAALTQEGDREIARQAADAVHVF